MRDPNDKPGRLFTFASAGWVLVLTAVLAVIIFLAVLVPALQRQANRPPGDGRDPETYGFDLSTSLVSRETLVAGQLHRDLLKALVDPPVMSGADVEAYNREMRGKYLVPADLVIGVSIGGETRAYPVTVLNLHEIVNDHLGGTPIVVTYSPLCHSAIVYDRGPDPAPPVFGVSGLLHNSNLLMYDRGHAPGDAESLWSQIDGRAVTGPAAAAGLALRRVRSVVTQWSDWLARHPDTTVIDPDPALRDRYKGTSYAGYYRKPDLLFPVAPMPPADGLEPKTPCVVVFAGGERRIYPFDLVAERADADGRWSDTLGDAELEFLCLRDPAAVTVTEAGAPADTITCLWFAWYSLDPEIEVAQ
ncbi:MAG: DUF3179 domain-containing protein [Planctomycetes bacterium]|nr:DUF3179 domain-containing protein [Planctomycetota bacterium]